MTYTPYQFANNASSTVAGGAGGLGTPLSSGDTTLYLPTGHGARFPASGYFMLLIGPVLTGENVKVTLRSTDTLTIVRAQEGTSAATWPVGTTVQQIVSAQSLNDGMSELATLDSAKANLSGATFTGNVTAPGLFWGAGASGNLSNVQWSSPNHENEYWTPQAGGAAQGHLFLGWDGSGLVALFSVGSTGVTGLAQIDASGTYIGLLAHKASGSAASIASSGTIATSGLGVSRVSAAAAVTGVIVQAGTLMGQQCIILNESGFSITMAATGTSHVADGASCVIPASRAMWFVWDTGNSLWYHS